MMLRATLAALALMIAAPAIAAPSQAELMQKAVEGAAACSQAMPDNRATGDLLKAASFSLAEANGNLKAYTAMGNRVVVIITTAANRMDACFVLASKMTPAQAETLIQPWVKIANARQFPMPEGAPFEKSWIGSFKGGPVELLIDDYVDFRIVRGAAIIARVPVR